ncbi:hypothetical protein [Pseudomonas sp. UBA5568]|uniref:hypothetical protein n=1 Tax=Pseudomonas sp. UBA5568 TaxID=1947319 RepID=UPI0025976AE8|nr:hypothetical protein [Pseudomonas sp. UBA5568]
MKSMLALKKIINVMMVCWSIVLWTSVLQASENNTYGCDQSHQLEPHAFSVIANIDFHSPDDDSVSRELGSILTYPQGFYIDEKDNELYLLRYTDSLPKKAILEIYDWPAGSYKKTLYLKDTGGVISEGLYVSSSNGKSRSAYIRAKEGIKVYNFTSDAKTTEKVAGEYITKISMAQSFSFFAGQWYVEAPEDGGQARTGRGKYNVYAENFIREGVRDFDPRIAGYGDSEKRDLLKHQGFAKFKSGFVMSIGGFWRRSWPVTGYSTQGVAIFSNDSKCRVIYTIAADRLSNMLAGKKFAVDRLENEGVQILQDGSVILLNIYQIYRKRRGGIVILQVDINKADVE